MRIMVIGAQAAGKSTFAEKLGEKLSIPVINLDSIVNGQGRDRRIAGELICRAAEKPDWIMDGNAFTSDRNVRLEKTDYIFLFTSHPVKSFVKHLCRWATRSMKSDRDGRNGDLHLGFTLSFVFRRWPKREKEVVQHAQSLHKKLIYIRNHEEADDYLKKLDIEKMRTLDPDVEMRSR